MECCFNCEHYTDVSGYCMKLNNKVPEEFIHTHKCEEFEAEQKLTVIGETWKNYLINERNWDV